MDDGVACGFNDDDAEQISKLSFGQTVTILGICRGLGISAVIVEHCKLK